MNRNRVAFCNPYKALGYIETDKILYFEVSLPSDFVLKAVRDIEPMTQLNFIKHADNILNHVKVEKGVTQRPFVPKNAFPSIDEFVPNHVAKVHLGEKYEIFSKGMNLHSVYQKIFSEKYVTYHKGFAFEIIWLPFEKSFLWCVFTPLDESEANEKGLVPISSRMSA